MKRWWWAAAVVAGALLGIWIKVCMDPVKETSFGQNWVDTEILLFTIPGLPAFSQGAPIQFKPITGASLLGFVLFMLILEGFRQDLRGKGEGVKAALSIIALFLCLGFGYEALWNLGMMFALAARGAPIDSAMNPYYPVNLIFASKVCVTGFAMTLYAVYYLHTIRTGNDTLIEI